jgi:hypothetical protein
MRVIREDDTNLSGDTLENTVSIHVKWYWSPREVHDDDVVDFEDEVYPAAGFFFVRIRNNTWPNRKRKITRYFDL